MAKDVEAGTSGDTSVDAAAEAASEASKRVVLEAIGALPAELRSEIIDDLLETYCSMCAERLDEEGECPEGCDPEDMLNDDDEDDEEEDEPEETGS